MKNLKAFVIFLLLFSVSSGVYGRAKIDLPKPAKVNTGTVKIMSFNMRIFGVSKMSKPEVVKILADIVSGADIIAVQEVRSAEIGPVEQFMALLPERYRYIIGPRQGRTRSKEQYWIVYDAAKFAVGEGEVWEDEADVFERSPFAVYIQSYDKFDFILMTSHIQPDAAEKEINALPLAADFFKRRWKESDILIAGDFNADGVYYNEEDFYTVFDPAFYTSIIGGEDDTTVAESSNAYDRFVIGSSAAEDYTGNHGIVRFDEIYDWSRAEISPEDVSDHYPVWAEFAVGRDTD